MLERHASGSRCRRDQCCRRSDRAAGVGEGGTGFVIGDIGPFGGLMEPLGEHSAEQVYACVSGAGERSAGGRCGTPSSSRRKRCWTNWVSGSTRRVKRCCQCVIASVAFDVTLETKELRTMMGTTPEQAAEFTVEKGADILGFELWNRHRHEAGGRSRPAVQELLRSPRHGATQRRSACSREPPGRVQTDARSDGRTRPGSCWRSASS